MTTFEETTSRTVRSAARAVLPDDSAAGQFCDDLDWAWGFLRRGAERHSRMSAVEKKTGLSVRAEKGAHGRAPTPLLDGGAVLLRLRQRSAGQHVTSAELEGVTWRSLSRAEQSRASKEIGRHLSSNEGIRVDVARRRELTRRIQLAVFALGGDQLKFSNSENAARTTGVRLILAAFRYLELPNVEPRVIALDLKALRPQTSTWRQTTRG